MYLFFLLLFVSWRTLDAQDNTFTINKAELRALPSNEMKSGGILNLTCSVEIIKSQHFILNHEVFFYKNDKLIYSVNSSREFETYTLNPARVSNSGSYKCKVKLENKEKTSKDLDVKVTGLSKPVLRLSKKEVKEGDDISVTCEAPGEEPPFLFTFYKSQQNKETQEKVRNSQSRQSEVVFTIEEGEKVLKFQCKVKILSVAEPETSEPSDYQWVTVAEPFSTPKFEVSPSLNFTEGINMSVKCSILKAPNLQDPVEITIQKDKAILESSKTGEAVYRHLATVNQMGNYTCKAESTKTTKTSSVYIYVAELFPRPHLYSNKKNSTMNDGDVLSLSCSVPGLSHQALNNLTFYLQKDSESRITMYRGGKYSKKVMERDSGLYVCEVTISNITKRSNGIYTKIYAPVSKPVLTHITTGNTTVVLGQTIKLSCKSEYGTLPITYSLLRGSENLGKIVMYKKEEAVFNLTMTKSHNLQQYKCLAENGNTASYQYSNATTITAIVPVKAVNLTIIPSDGAVEEGSELTLVCSVRNGSLPITFEFYVKKENDIRLNKISTDKSYAEFEIRSFNKQDDGSYFCKASNKANNGVKSNYMHVRAVLATWKKGIIGVFVVFIIVAAVAISVYFYLDRKKKGREIELDMARTTNSTNSNKEKPEMEMKNEEDSYFVSGTIQAEDENHVAKTPEENQGNNLENHEVDYTEVEVTTPNPHRAPVKKGTDTVYSEIRKSNHDAGENNSTRTEDSPNAT